VSEQPNEFVHEIGLNSCIESTTLYWARTQLRLEQSRDFCLTTKLHVKRKSGCVKRIQIIVLFVIGIHRSIVKASGVAQIHNFVRCPRTALGVTHPNTALGIAAASFQTLVAG